MSASFSFFATPQSTRVPCKKKQEMFPTFGRRLNSIHPTTTVVSPGKLWSLCQRERPSKARWKKEKKRKCEVEPLADLKYFKAGEAKGNFVTGGGWEAIISFSALGWGENVCAKSGTEKKKKIFRSHEFWSDPRKHKCKCDLGRQIFPCASL